MMVRMTKAEFRETEPLQPADQSPTLAGEVFARLRADIVSSRLPPGAKLRLEELRQTYGVGFSPLREALSRLAESRLVVSIGQRGFRVPEVSAKEIMDISMVRKEIEGFALRLAIRHGDDLWEARLAAAGEKFAELQRSVKVIAEDIWESRHRDFHSALIAACQSPWLLHLHGVLTDQFDRYRRLSAKSRLPSAPRWLSHKGIMQAAIARNADKAVKLLDEHIGEATRLIVAGFLAAEEQANAPVRKRKAGPAQRRSA
jgi:GntR family transcriptional regulator, carbon starvation induced regulator